MLQRVKTGWLRSMAGVAFGARGPRHRGNVRHCHWMHGGPPAAAPRPSLHSGTCHQTDSSAHHAVGCAQGRATRPTLEREGRANCLRRVNQGRTRDWWGSQTAVGGVPSRWSRRRRIGEGRQQNWRQSARPTLQVDESHKFAIIWACRTAPSPPPLSHEGRGEFCLRSARPQGERGVGSARA
jgi:hypothetical protein